LSISSFTLSAIVSSSLLSKNATQSSFSIRFGFSSIISMFFDVFLFA